MLKKSALKGKLGEWAGVLWLSLKGYKVIELNNKTGGIEGDIIASKENSIILIEVKVRKSRKKAHIAVHPTQQMRLQRKLRIMSKKYKNNNLRIDLMLIYPTPPFIEHVKNVFYL